MVSSVVKSSFAKGEVSPGFWGHISHDAFAIACSTCRNMFVSIRGGAYSRAGTLFCGVSKQPASASSTPPRLIPNQFSTGQGYILEFGGGYVRFLANGGYITEAPINITAASQSNPLAVTIPGNDFAPGDSIYIVGVDGMFEINGQTLVVRTVSGNVITFNDAFGIPVNSLAYAAYVDGGTAARIYTVATPYAVADLPYLKFSQSADLMSLCLSNPTDLTEYAPQDLDRLAANDWTLTETNFGSIIAAPATCTVTPSSVDTTNRAQWAYCVTAVDAKTGQESVASPVGYTTSDAVDFAVQQGSATINWSPVAGAGSYNVYKAIQASWLGADTPAQVVPIGSAFGFAGSAVGTQWVDNNVIQDFTTTPPLHLNPFAPGQILAMATPADTPTFIQASTTGVVNSATGSNAVILPVIVSSTDPGDAGPIVAAIIENPGQDYQPGDTVTFTDSSSGNTLTVGLTIGPESGTYPGVVAYFQDRRGYADTLNDPDTYFFSQTGAFTNFDAADPPIDSDSITGTPWAQQVNGVQWMIPMPGGVIACTGLDCWQLSGTSGAGSPFTPSSQDATAEESYGFSSTVAPIRIGDHFLYVDTFGTEVRDNVYNFFTNTFQGDDLTELSNHLFDNYQIVQWAWARKPFKIIWCVRSDGALLSLTYLKEQQVVAWARHDTNGQVVSVAVASEPPVDAVYVVVKRYIQGKNAYAYFVERMDNRLWPNAEATWCVDAGLSLGLPAPSATLTPSATGPAGTAITLAASAAVFDGVTTGVPGQVVRVDGGKAVVAAFISPTELAANITVPLTGLTPDIAQNLTQVPVPAPPGEWTIATPVATISGLNHLEGMTVTGLADGAVIPPAVVVDGTIALPFAATAVTVGLPFQWQVQSLHLQDNKEEVQDRRKRVIGVTVRLEASRGVKVGANQPNASAQENQANIPWGNYPWGKMTLIPEIQNQIGPNQYLPLFTGDHFIPIDDDWNTIGQSASPGMIALQGDFPLPGQILALVPRYSVGDTLAP